MRGRARKALLGAAFWIAGALGVAAAVRTLDPETRQKLDHVEEEMRRAFLDPAPTYTIHFRGGTHLERGNGVLALVDGQLARVGEVVRVRADEPLTGDVLATIALDTGASGWRPRAGSVAICRSQGRSLLFALRTLVPAARWRQIQEEWRSFRFRHQAELAAELEPLASQLFSLTLRAVAAELPDVLERHRGEIEQLVKRMREGLGREQVQPLLVEELWPIVVSEMAGPAESIGRELWDRVPLMSFALRAAADRILEDEPVRVEERWRRFVQEEALPILRARQPELEMAFGRIVKQALASEDIQARAAAVWETIRSDPQVRELARVLTRELLVENKRLDAALRAVLDDPATRERARRLGERFQEFFDPLGELLLLDESRQGINPDLAYLIRLLLLRRDEQVLYVERSAEEAGAEPAAAIPVGAELEGRDESS